MPIHWSIAGFCARCLRSTEGDRIRGSTLVVVLGALVAHAPTGLHAQGVRFTLAPSAEHVWWDKALGLENAPLYGARLGADFGPLVSVSGFYHLGQHLGVSRDSARTALGAFTGARRTETDVQAYGATLALRLSPARLAPFLSAGAGVTRFVPDSAVTRDLITVRLGTGLQYDPSPNLRAMVMIENARFRLDQGQLFAPTAALVLATDTKTMRSNWALSAALGLAIGGTRGDDDTDSWSAGSIPVEAFAGRLEFDDKSIQRQALVGVRTGVDVGQYVGLRAFYWQGRSGNLEERRPLQSYGGEAQLNLTRSRGPSPYLVFGAGRLDFGKDFRDRAGRGRDPETALIGGAGVALRLSDQLRLTAAVRDYLRGPQNLDSLRSTTQISNNLLYQVGVGFDFGRSHSQRKAPGREADDRRTPPDRRARRMVDTVFVDRDSLRTRRELDPRAGARTITLPAPLVGELYVRYGDSTQRTIPGRGAISSPATAANDSLVRTLRAQIDSLEAQLRAGAPAADRDAQLRTLRARIDSLALRLRDKASMPPEAVIVTAPAASRPPRTPEPAPIMQVSEVSPYVAGFGQLALGVMLDAGPILGIPALHLVPDFALGLGSDPSISLAVGAQFNFAQMTVHTPGLYQPYVRAGLGFLAASGDRDSKFGLNLAYGLTYTPERRPQTRSTDHERRTPSLFVEHQGIDFFSTNRFLLGVRVKTR
jgi:hypothetical protein